MKSVLLVADQEAGSFPDRCVLTGEKTETAVYVWAIESSNAQWLLGVLGYLGVILAKLAGRQTIRLGVPITQRPWGIWKRRANLYLAMTSAGFGFVLAGFFQSSVGFVVFGIILAAASRAQRMRALQNYWIIAELKPRTGHILVRPTHADFDAKAREMFQRSI